jgi:hypothetical protein
MVGMASASSPSAGGPGRGTGPGSDAGAAAEAIAAALRTGAFDPQHAGELFLRAGAERAVRAALGPGARIAVAGRDEAGVRAVTFMGARFSPDLVVETAAGGRVAVTITLLRGDSGPVAGALANALVLSGRYQAVVAFVLDRRLARRDPFGDAGEAPAARELNDTERAFLDQLWQRHSVRVEVRRQDPFGW